MVGEIPKHRHQALRTVLGLRLPGAGGSLVGLPVVLGQRRALLKFFAAVLAGEDHLLQNYYNAIFGIKINKSKYLIRTGSYSMARMWFGEQI